MQHFLALGVPTAVGTSDLEKEYRAIVPGARRASESDLDATGFAFHHYRDRPSPGLAYLEGVNQHLNRNKLDL